MKKAARILAGILLIMLFQGCAENDDIHVISRESGSGTREAFIQLTGIKQNGCDNTTITSEITSSALVAIKSVEEDENAIGYTSMGTLKGNVKVIKIDGAFPTAENAANGSYPISGNFNIIFKEPLTFEAVGFMNFIFDKRGRKIIEDEGYVCGDNKFNEENTAYKDRKYEKKQIVIAGSTSIAPLMEVLAEEYMKLNPHIRIEIQQSGSSAGITSVTEGACHLGMSSRELTEKEQSKGLKAVTMAIDGIAVIVNPQNPIKDLTVEDVRKIFTGETKEWGVLKQ